MVFQKDRQNNSKIDLRTAAKKSINKGHITSPDTIQHHSLKCTNSRESVQGRNKNSGHRSVTKQMPITRLWTETLVYFTQHCRVQQSHDCPLLLVHPQCEHFNNTNTQLQCAEGLMTPNECVKGFLHSNLMQQQRKYPFLPSF